MPPFLLIVLLLLGLGTGATGHAASDPSPGPINRTAPSHPHPHLHLSGKSGATATTAPATSTVPSGFQDSTVISGLDLPTAFAFAPDGKVFVAEQRGVIKEFSSLSDTQPSIYADLRTNVDNYEDRGLLGLAVDPNWPTSPNVYALYTYDAAIGGQAPKWGTAGNDDDPCPDPYGTGCLASARLSRLQQGPSTSVSYANAVSADTPAAYWRLAESSSTTAADASGNGHAGTYVGSPTLGVSGALVSDTNTAAAFNGSSQYVETPYSGALNPAQFTVEAWAYVTGGAGTFRSVVTSRDNTGGPTKGYAIYAAGNDTWEFWIGNGSSSGWTVAFGPSVQLNTWTHLVATFDGTTARLYVNGIQAADAVPTPFAANTSKPLRIAAGGTEGSPRYFFPGRVDEVAVYPSALTPTRIHAHYESATGTPPLASETVLINDWCQQYTSESIGTLRFGPDGALYAGSGPAASFTFNDYGQNGNPCGDPPSPAGTSLTTPTAQGGSLRSQNLLTSANPVTLDGSIIRVDPSTGAAEPDNPNSSSSDPNKRRIIAYGLRNPFRFNFRPGTNPPEIWIGDVGGGTYEEIDRVLNPLASPMDFGWPCYEGTPAQPGFQSLGLNMCNNLYNSPGSVTAPYFQYAHLQPVSSLDTCQFNISETAISGIAFIPSSAPYPSSYQGDLVFTDYGRGCIWSMSIGSNGLPDPSTTQVLVGGAGNPVDLEIGRDNKLYWDDIGTGTIHRLDFTASSPPPTAVASANPTSGTAPLTVNFDGSGSTAPNGDPLAYSWDLNGDGVFGDSMAVKPQYTYSTAGTYTVKLMVTDTVTTLSSTSSPITISVSSSTSGTYASTVLADGPAAYWRLGEASGTTAADSSVNNRPGTYFNSPTLGLAGALTGDSNTSVGFDGSSQYMQVPFSSVLNPNAFSVEAWVYPTGGAGTFRSVVTSRDVTNSSTVMRGYVLYASDADNWQLWLGSGAGHFNRLTGPAVQLNTWTYLVATYDGTTASLYVNGTLVASGAMSYAPNTAQPLRAAAGATETSPRYFFPGRLDEVAVYGSALSATRITAHYNAGIGGSTPPPTAVASANPTSGTAPLTVNFDGSGSSAPNGDPLSYSWDLNGDGVFGDSTAVKPSFTYTQAGTYTVKLMVTDTVTTLSSTSSPLTITVSSSTSSTYASTVLADGPAAYWRLGEASGTTAADSSGNNRPGTYFNSPTLGLAGALTGDSNTAVGFDGSSEDVQVPFASALNPNAFSVEAWVYPTGGAGTFRSVVTSRDVTNSGSVMRGYILYASDADNWQLWLGSGAGNFNRLVGPAVQLNTWTYLVATYDGTTASLYVNGTLAASGAMSYAPNTAQPLRAAAGATETSPRYFFPGRLDELAVYGSALSATRITAHYNAGTGH